MATLPSRPHDRAPALLALALIAACSGSERSDGGVHDGATEDGAAQDAAGADGSVQDGGCMASTPETKLHEDFCPDVIRGGM